MTSSNTRSTEYDINPVFLDRWSPRAFTGEAISERDLLTILDAAHWAPSSYNSQPWRFIYARKDTAHWDKLFGLLHPFNQSWVKAASALVIVVSDSTMLPPGKEQRVPSRTHSFDAGAAWGYLALQATMMGWAAHGMAGFDVDRAFTELNVPEGYRVEAAIAIGRKGDKSLLSEKMAAREAPSPRLALSEVALEGGF
ncbi:MAG TPA: nitroreductase family protein [Stellaceae bacterium]|jgi:nitroreductase|nr:nitroreductase family protein [Stellaceae bacterium]